MEKRMKSEGKAKALAVKQVPGEEVPAEIIASAIVKIGKAAEEMANSGLRRRTVVILLAESSRIAKRDVEKVLDALDSLRRTYTTR
jgi:hypothetical protein